MTNAVVWSQPNCHYCRAAKQLLHASGYQIEERMIGSGWTKEQFFEANPGAKTVPQIYLNGTLVEGGYLKLKDYLRA